MLVIAFCLGEVVLLKVEFVKLGCLLSWRKCEVVRQESVIVSTKKLTRLLANVMLFLESKSGKWRWYGQFLEGTNLSARGYFVLF